MGFDSYISLEDKLKNFDNLFCYDNKQPQKVVSPRCEYYSPNLYTYNYNNYGYRSIEFSKDVDILTIGCSHTFGSGLPFEYTWPQQLQALIPDKKIATLAWPGYSVQKLISLIFIYFKKIGNPKMIICNFPDFYRMLFLLKDSHKIVGYYTNIEDNSFFDKKNKKEIKNSTPSSYWGFYLSYDYIMMLEQYCFSNNIKLIWSSWSRFDLDLTLNEKTNNEIKNYHDNDLKILNIFNENKINPVEESLKNNFNYYYKEDYKCRLYFGTPNCQPSQQLKECHKELQSKTQDFFEIAYDRYILPEEDINNFEKHLKMSQEEKNKNINPDPFFMGHHGSHKNAHWAEFYYGIIKEQYPEFI